MWETYTLWPGATLRVDLTLLAAVVMIVVAVVARKIRAAR